jgi:Tn3 transposase DDE domain
MYMLDYVADESFRRQIQGSLNSGEAFHQLQRNIASVNGGDKLRGRDGKELTLWNGSSNVIANCILYYNTYILSRALEHYQREGNQIGIDIVTQASPVAWSHICLSGYFLFASNDEEYQVSKMIDELKMLA